MTSALHPETHELYESILNDTWPSVRVRRTFSLFEQPQYDAYYYLIKVLQMPPEKLDRFHSRAQELNPILAEVNIPPLPDYL